MPSILLLNEAAAMLNSGCAIVSTSVPAISGTYALDNVSLLKLGFTALYVHVNGKFPGGGATWTLKDMNGLDRVVPDAAAFLRLASAIAEHVVLLNQIIDNVGGAPTSLPAQPKVIA